jgi:transposase
MKKRPPCVVGIDVSKDHLDLACRPDPTRWRVAHDSAGMAACLSQLRQLKPALVVLEATGGWQCALAAALAVATRPFAVVNPRHTRDVAQATGPWAKTDTLEAGVIAHVAAAVRPTPRPLPDEMTQPIDALLQRRRPRLEMWVAARHRVALAHSTVRDRLARPIDDLPHLIHETDAEVATRIRTRPAWREPDAW